MPPTKTVAILAEHHYQDLELHYPRLRLKEAGYEVRIVGTGSATGYVGKYGYPTGVDAPADAVSADDFDALVIPGGWAPDRLRQSDAVLKLVRDMVDAGKPVACICHGGWVLASAGVLAGRRVTAYRAIRDDVVNAGATFVDQEVVVDGNLVTSRMPDDLPAFMRELLERLA